MLRGEKVNLVVNLLKISIFNRFSIRFRQARKRAALAFFPRRASGSAAACAKQMKSLGEIKGKQDSTKRHFVKNAVDAVAPQALRRRHRLLLSSGV